MGSKYGNGTSVRVGTRWGAHAPSCGNSKARKRSPAARLKAFHKANEEALQEARTEVLREQGTPYPIKI